MIFVCYDEALADLGPSQPFRRTSKPIINDYYEKIDKGEPPHHSSPAQPAALKLKLYSLTKDFYVVLNHALEPFPGISESQQKQLKSLTDLFNVSDKLNCLSTDNYTEMLHTFLYLEEHQMSKDIRDYDCERALTQVKGSNLLQLEVPGLAESRPSVIMGDIISVKESKTATIIYQGFVHRVAEGSVCLNFSPKFVNKVYVPGRKFYISFSFNRFPLKVEHQAVELVEMHKTSALFFPKMAIQEKITEQKISWFNSNILNNPEQQQAVQAILQRTAQPAPYIIFGPPGTGKTMTVVEAVKQVHKRENLNILVCAPSNNAANEVCRRLIDTIPTTDLFRLVAQSVHPNQLPGNLVKFSNFKNGPFYHPSIEELTKYRIVVSTLVTASRLVNGGCPEGHFGYVFIDEAGQATESETLIGISGILTGPKNPMAGQVVLAGDPQQLGPIIHSTFAAKFGFGISMLERSMTNLDIYKKTAEEQCYNPRLITKLLKNYRSHPAIIKTPNELFYDNELQSAGDNLINLALGWEELPNKDCPVIFHNVVGSDVREQNSPSFFNLQEVDVVMSYLEKLIGNRLTGMNIREEHIAVISPYKKQVEKFRLACQKKKYTSGLMIGSVEQMQGQERLIIILSTVRSRPKFMEFDNKFHLGFLKNPKRFNVAITRAKALLIVVGNANMLQSDLHWAKLISFCANNSALKGQKFELVEVNKDIASDVDSQLIAQNSAADDDVLTLSDISELNIDDGLEPANFSRGNI